jgi:TolB-like protein/DNA-binding winged helix-turn-helix (wHTH) protein/Flp pilus assembly protein TadD
MPDANPTSGRLQFGVFEVDLRAGELRKHGLRIRLQEQPFQVLATLLEHPREVVTREELQKRVWPADTFVDFDHGLNKAINKIREALSDSTENPRFIETVARRGYRFLVDVAPIASEPVPSAPPGSAPHPPSLDRPPVPLDSPPVPRPASLLAWRILAAALLVLVLVAAFRLFSPAHSAPAIHSLAVLPLESLSSDTSQDFFADGMTDELITHLGQISALRVISRTSVMPYKKTSKPLPQIARELDVDAVVEGTVLHSGNQVRITAQLIAVHADKHLWAQSYEGDLSDTLTLQSQVARAIAEHVRVSLNPQEQAALQKTKVVNREAYVSYLKGRYFWNKRTADGLKAAKSYFDEAVALDATCKQAYAGLADTYSLLGDWQYAVMAPKEALPKAKAAAIKALELDNSLGEAHNSLAFVLEGYDWDFAAAEKEFQRAIELNPNYATAHHWYAWHLSLLGRNAEALAEMRRAQNLDPLSLIINADLAELLLIAHFPDDSIQQGRKTIEMDPNFGLGHYQLAQAYLEKKMYSEAIAELQTATRLSGDSPTWTATLARAHAASGNQLEAQKLLDDLKTSYSPGDPHASDIAVVYAALGDKDQAFAWLQKGYGQRFNPGVLLRPGFDPLRSDPRFQNLLRRIGLPATS